MKNLKILFQNMELFIPYIGDQKIEYSHKVHRGYRLQDKFMKLCPNGSHVLISNWKKEINTTDIFVMFDSHYSKYIAEYIKKNNPNSKIYFYFWNSINDKNIHFFSDTLIDEFWTFDKADSIKYGINYNPQFYTENIELGVKNLCIDTLFIGREKNRKNLIDDTSNLLQKYHINSEICLVKNNDTLYSYPKYLDKVAISKSLLDIVCHNQSGLTLRCMEALFFKKKLITSNQKIVEYDFYSPHNIFILGKDNEKNLLEFINSDYVDVDDSIISSYDYKAWVKRFMK